MNLMGHIKLLEFYGLRLMVLLTFHDFEGHSKKRIDHHNRITDLKNVFGQSFPKAGECKAQENIIKFHNIFKDKVIEEN